MCVYVMHTYILPTCILLPLFRYCYCTHMHTSMMCTVCPYMQCMVLRHIYEHMMEVDTLWTVFTFCMVCAYIHSNLQYRPHG